MPTSLTHEYKGTYAECCLAETLKINLHVRECKPLCTVVLIRACIDVLGVQSVSV